MNVLIANFRDLFHKMPKSTFKWLIVHLFFNGICVLTLSAQNCPPNIDFENGNFNGWQCYIGSTASVGGRNVITLNPTSGPIDNRHTMYSANPGDGMDEYGDFPKNCPNGSGHSIRLGNNLAGTQAEGVSYDFTIPANANVYNLIYNYAVVFEDPSHLPSEQPRMEIEITNLTTNTLITCSSFTFYPIGSALPGFELSPVADITPVWFKRWTAVSINLDGNAGNKIRLFFKTADCTFRRHFGYAYIDVNTECSDKFEGAAFCPDDTAVNVNAPYGYQSYTWYNSTFTQILGTQQTLNLVPPPPTGTRVAVILEPYNGYGCTDTLYTDLSDTLHMLANAGPDKVSCNKESVQIGVPPKPGWIYQWTPVAGLNEAEVANPLAIPDITTDYTLSIKHNGGGCRSNDMVRVVADNINDSIALLGKPAWCLGSGDSTVLVVQPADSIQWYKNGVPIPGATLAILHVTQTGIYNARLHNNTGCTLFTDEQNVFITSVPVPSASVNNNAQCRVGNKFIFNNSSTNAVGEMFYLWKFGDGDSALTRNVTHIYDSAGTYRVVMCVYSSSACGDSTVMIVNVWENLVADFSINKVCIGKPLQLVNKTIVPVISVAHYLWSFGNGISSTQKDPPVQTYPVAGNYIVSLTTWSDQCPLPVNTLKRFAFVDAPKMPMAYPVQIAVVDLPLQLEARNIGDNILWKPATSLDNPNSYTPIFRGNAEQLYTIELRTNSGCLTVDTQLVKIHPKVEIYVPNSFTPNNDGRNDDLQPYTIGIKSISFFRIFNRWGQMIFETHHLGTGWDGRFKGNRVESQAFVWEIEAIGADNIVYRQKGSSILIR
jgi:gliding motility-associated-like protein